MKPYESAKLTHKNRLAPPPLCGAAQSEREENNDSKAELGMTRVKALYLTQQVQVLAAENELMKKEKTELATEKNRFRKMYRNCDLELTNIRSDLKSYQELVTSDGFEEQRREVLSLRGENEELMGRLEKMGTLEEQHKKVSPGCARAP